uniref:Uncharacterized protein n=1 Tax=Wuchereria bancrofti TaxID=6293 RepID=A0A1I8ETR4_WUCBA
LNIINNYFNLENFSNICYLIYFKYFINFFLLFLSFFFSLSLSLSLSALTIFVFIDKISFFKKFVSSMGGNYQQIRSCFQQKQPIIDKAMKCSQDSFPEACARGQPKMIKKRYTKGIEIAAMNEINKQLQRMGK